MSQYHTGHLPKPVVFHLGQIPLPSPSNNDLSAASGTSVRLGEDDEHVPAPSFLSSRMKTDTRLVFESPSIYTKRTLIHD